MMLRKPYLVQVSDLDNGSLARLTQDSGTGKPCIKTDRAFFINHGNANGMYLKHHVDGGNISASIDDTGINSRFILGC